MFLPFAGCPNRCVFCAQPSITGQRTTPLDQAFETLKKDLEDNSNKQTKPLELAFYGGTFTALPAPWPRRFMELAATYRQRGLITRVRCSTRPDAITKEGLKPLQALGLQMVELGIQSFSQQALKATRRGYGQAQARQACQTVVNAGMDLGIQLLPGLPGHSLQAFKEDIAIAASFVPKAMRLYPCVVIQGTELARLWQQKNYAPWPLDQTIQALAEALLTCWQAGVPVIRMGLAPEQDLMDSILDGPWHPALGQMAKSLALFLHIKEILGSESRQPARLTVPKQYESDFAGHGKDMLPRYAELGLTQDRVTFQPQELFELAFE